MENMKAVKSTNYGGPEVLSFEDAPRPTPGSGELLIRVHAASVNAIDWKARAGYLKDVFPLPLPYIPGWDVSGIVEAVGSGVTKFKKGDEVYARPDASRNGKALMRNTSWSRKRPLSQGQLTMSMPLPFL